MEDLMEDLLTLKEAAKCVRQHPETLRRAIHCGELAARRVGRQGVLYISIADLKRYAKGVEVKAEESKPDEVSNHG